jgi:CheY-like chemotaxis protein
MDMQMPVMDGEDATLAIRALPPPKCNIPILALTADVMPEHRERYLRAGVNAMVAKPIDWGALAAALEACCETRGRGDGI